MDDDLSLDPERAALCLVEMQNDIVHESNVGKRGLKRADPSSQPVEEVP